MEERRMKTQQYSDKVAQEHVFFSVAEFDVYVYVYLFKLYNDHPASTDSVKWPFSFDFFF